MGKRGPAKKPKAAAKRDGTYRPDRHDGLDLPAAIPEPPIELDPEARAHWDRLASQLGQAGILSDVDSDALSLLANTIADYWRARAVVATEGITSVTDKGNVIQHPAVGVMSKHAKNLLTLCREFGMTPSSRSGLNLGNGSKETDPLVAALLSRAGNN